MTFKSNIKTALTILFIYGTAQSLPLNGEYTIGATGDFLNLEAAIDEIETEGISAPVTLKIEAQTYLTHVTINDFTRSGQANDLLTITALDPLIPPILQYDAQTEGDNWVIRLNQVSHIKFSHLVLEAIGTMDLNNIITLENESSNIEITDNEFNSYAISASTNVTQGAAINNTVDSGLSEISIINNVFNSGNSAVRLKGVFNTNISSVKINHNIFNDQIGTGSFNGINLNGIDDLTVNFNVINNQIFNSKGMNFFGINRGEIAGNKIAMLGGGAGGTALAIGKTNEALEDFITIKNNFIAASKVGLEIRSPQGNNINVLNNTVVIDSQFLSVVANALKVGSATNNITVRNNILINAVDSMTSYVMTLSDSAAITASDGNVFFGPTDHQFEVNDVIYPDLLAYQTATSLDSNSVNKDVDFIDANNADFHLTSDQYNDVDLLTSAATGVVFDIDGESRDVSTHLIGADDLPFTDLIFESSFESND